MLLNYSYIVLAQKFVLPNVTELLNTLLQLYNLWNKFMHMLLKYIGKIMQQMRTVLDQRSFLMLFVVLQCR